MALDEWLAERIREFEGLRGRRIVSWTCVEMAVREEAVDGSGPLFTDPAVPFLQLWRLGAVLDDGAFLVICTYRDDEGFGMWLNPSGPFDPAQGTGIFRLRDLPELPVGKVDEVAVVVEEELLAEVSFAIAGRPLLLMAGEVYERMDGSLTFARYDESVLTFASPAAADTVEWSPPRHRDHGLTDSGMTAPAP